MSNIDLAFNTEVVEKIISTKDAAELERASEYRLTDAMREGSAHTNQAYGSWGESNSMCALTTAAHGAKARGYI